MSAEKDSTRQTELTQLRETFLNLKKQVLTDEDRVQRVHSLQLAVVDFFTRHNINDEATRAAMLKEITQA